MPDPVYLYHSSTQGFDRPPTINPVVTLKKALIDGIPPVTVQSYVESGGELSLTLSTAFPMAVGQTIKITGANESQYNSAYSVIRVISDTVIVVNSGGLPTGNLSVEIPPLGWELVFSDATNNKLIVRPDASANNRLYYEFTHNNNRMNVVCGSRYDAANNTVIFPISPSSRGWIIDATQNFHIIGDKRGFYYVCDHSYTIVPYLSFFGEFIAASPNDTFAGCCTNGSTNNPFQLLQASGDGTFPTPSGVPVTLSVTKSYNRIVKSPYENGYNLADGKMYFQPLRVLNGFGYRYRGEMPGLYICTDGRGVLHGSQGNPKIITISGISYLYIKTTDAEVGSNLISFKKQVGNPLIGLLIKLDSWR